MNTILLDRDEALRELLAIDRGMGSHDCDHVAWEALDRLRALLTDAPEADDRARSAEKEKGDA